MSYKTNLTLNKRQQLKAQMDDFATFQWRGHDMFDDFGCFIINDKNGSLKFYNGPGFSNQYAKPQFSKSVNGLLGVDWKQQTIPMKVGLYWFTIEEYQEFLNCINPYEINYLTFDYAPDYGYLVKLGKIADSTRHIVGRNENGEIVYYTEMDLTWELVGDTCVRSNTPYEYKRREESDILDCYTWEFDNEKSDMKDDSLLDTGVIFEIPLEFNKDTANLSFKAFYETENEDKYANLFEINLENLTYSGENDSPDGPNEPEDDTITYTVEWIVNGTVAFRESVIDGGSVTAPIGLSAPDGYVITGWEPRNFSNIQRNMVFTAVLQEISSDEDPNHLITTTWKIKEQIELPSVDERYINILSNNTVFSSISVQDISGSLTVIFTHSQTGKEYIATATNDYSTFTILGGSSLEKEQTVSFLNAIADQFVPEQGEQGDWLILSSNEITIPENGLRIPYGGIAYKGNEESSVFSAILLYGSVGKRKWAFNIDGSTSLIYDESTGKTGEWLSFKFNEPDNLEDEHIVALKHFAKNDNYPDTPEDDPDNPDPDDPDTPTPDPDPDEPVIKYTVNFYNYNGEVISSKEVEIGAVVSQPEDTLVLPDNKHTRLIKWSTDEYNYVEGNLEVYPILEYGHKRTLNTDLTYVADYDYIPLEFVYKDVIYTSITATKDGNGNLAGYRFVGETGSKLISDANILNSPTTIYVFDEYTALNNTTQRWLSDNTNLAPGERLIGPSIVDDFGYYGGPSAYGVNKESFGWVIRENATDYSYNITDIKNAVYCPCWYNNKTYTHWTKIRSYDNTQDYLVLMNFTDKSIFVVETDTVVPRALKVSFNDDNNTTQYIQYGNEVTPPNYAIDWNARIVGWNSDNEQSIYSVKAHTSFYPEIEYGTIYTLSKDGNVLTLTGTTQTYNDILYSYKINGIVFTSDNLTIDVYTEIIGEGNKNIWWTAYNDNETMGSKTQEGDFSWVVDNQEICVFKTTDEFNSFLSVFAIEQTASLLKMMSPRMMRSVEPSVVSTNNINNNPVMRLTLRYDSESGLLYVQEGANTTWHLLNYQTDNNNGDYILKSSVVKKWRIPGKFSKPSLQSTKWIFQLKSKQIKALNEEDIKTAITVYARKNIV